jgi:ATP-binding cassette subfamily B multidrug efflux pump
VPNLTNRIRWQNHRYVIRQSLGFFQNDYAGRIANRIMQTGASARVGGADCRCDLVRRHLHRQRHRDVRQGGCVAGCAAGVWLFAYVGTLSIFIPRTRERSWQASKRARS